MRYVRGTHAPKVGVTPKEVVWQRGKAQLWRYRNGPVRYGPPVLIVHSLVSRSYILDLRPGNSLVEHLTGAGLDVFLLDWGVPDELDADNDLERYVDFYLPRAVAAVRRESGSDEVTLAGYCLGGILAALYAAGHDDAAVRNLILMATPIDFDEMGAMVAFLREGRLTAEELVDDTGNVPADVLYSGFYMQAPTTEIAQKATLLENLWNDEFVEGFQTMAQWSRDHVPFPGALFRQLVEEFVRKNVLMTGSIRLGDRKVDLAERPRQRAQRHGRARQRRPAFRRRARHAARRRSRAARGAAAPRRPRHLRHRPQRGQAHDAEACRMDHRSLRRVSRTEGVVMEFRPITVDDEAELKRFFARIPEADRTFLKEDVDDPEVLAAWARPGTARVIAVDDGRGRRLGRGRPAARLVQPRRRGPPGRRPGAARTRHRPRARPPGRDRRGGPRAGQARGRGHRRPDGADRHVRRRSASSPRRCSPTTCATGAGTIRDLLVLANDVESQFASMATAGITEQL